MSAKQEFANRLNEVLDELGIPPKGQGRQEKVSEMFIVTSKGARKWLEGEGLPQLEKCIEICNKLKINVEWLLTGRGDKYAIQLNRRSSTDIPQDAIDVAVQWRGLPKNLRYHIRDFIYFQAYMIRIHPGIVFHNPGATYQEFEKALEKEIESGKAAAEP